MTASRILDHLRAWRFGHAQAALSSLGALCRAPLGTLLTSAVIGVALALPAGALIAVGSLVDVSTHFGTDSEISVFLHHELDDSVASGLAGRLATMEDVLRIRVITSAQALEEFRASAQAGYGLEGLGDANPLPAVLVVTPARPDESALADLAGRLTALPEVDFVQDDRDWLTRLGALAEVARRLLWLLSAILSAGIVLVVGNTVRLSIESRREEVEISKLFGASDSFVRRPFLYHGFYYGLAGALVAGVLLTASGLVLEPALERLAALYGGDLPFRRPGPWHYLGLLGTGSGLGLLGAWVWVGRHLRRVEPR